MFPLLPFDIGQVDLLQFYACHFISPPFVLCLFVLSNSQKEELANLLSLFWRTEHEGPRNIWTVFFGMWYLVALVLPPFLPGVKYFRSKKMHAMFEYSF